MNAPTTTRPPAAQLLIALCPAIAVSDLGANALGLGIAGLLAALVTAAAALLCRRMEPQLRWIVCVLVLAAAVSMMSLATNAWLHDLYGALGIFLPLLIANLSFQSQARSAPNAMRLGVNFVVLLLVLGLVRELVGRGSVLHDGSLLVGVRTGWQLFRPDMGFLLAMLPPGAFIAFGLLLAARNWFNQRRHG